MPLDILILISIRVPVAYRPEPPGKLRQSGYTHFMKSGEMRPWGSPVLLLYSHGQAYKLPSAIWLVRAKDYIDNWFVYWCSVPWAGQAS